MLISTADRETIYIRGTVCSHCVIILVLFLGAGGGWAPGNYTEDKKTTGSALLGVGGVSSDGGGVGGLACYKSRGNTKGFGGFGGGGGGCVAGGGGGGFTGKSFGIPPR